MNNLQEIRNIASQRVKYFLNGVIVSSGTAVTALIREIGTEKILNKVWVWKKYNDKLYY
jgi:hypothetical protein